MSDQNFEKPVKVTISDPDTGEVFEELIVGNDYLLVTVGNRYVKHIQVWGQTHTISVAVKPREKETINK